MNSDIYYNLYSPLAHTAFHNSLYNFKLKWLFINIAFSTVFTHTKSQHCCYNNSEKCGTKHLQTMCLLLSIFSRAH